MLMIKSLAFTFFVTLFLLFFDVNVAVFFLFCSFSAVLWVGLMVPFSGHLLLPQINQTNIEKYLFAVRTRFAAHLAAKISALILVFSLLFIVMNQETYRKRCPQPTPQERSLESKSVVKGDVSVSIHPKYIKNIFNQFQVVSAYSSNQICLLRIVTTGVSFESYLGLILFNMLLILLFVQIQGKRTIERNHLFRHAKDISMDINHYMKEKNKVFAIHLTLARPANSPLDDAPANATLVDTQANAAQAIINDDEALSSTCLSIIGNPIFGEFIRGILKNEDFKKNPNSLYMLASPRQFVEESLGYVEQFQIEPTAPKSKILNENLLYLLLSFALFFLNYAFLVFYRY